MKSGNNVCLIRGVKDERKGRRKGRVGILKIDDVQTFNTLNPRVDEQAKNLNSFHFSLPSRLFRNY